MYQRKRDADPELAMVKVASGTMTLVSQLGSGRRRASCIVPVFAGIQYLCADVASQNLR